MAPPPYQALVCLLAALQLDPVDSLLWNKKGLRLGVYCRSNEAVMYLDPRSRQRLLCLNREEDYLFFDRAIELNLSEDLC
jgi:hypothetical protein